MQRQSRGWFFYIGFLILIVVIVSVFSRNNASATTVSNTNYETMLESGSITTAWINQNSVVPTGSITFTTADGTFTVYVTDVTEAEKGLRDHNVSYNVRNISSNDILWNVILPVGLFALMIFFLFYAMRRNSGMNSANAKMMDFGKSSAKMSTADQQKTRFKDVAGLDEEKEEIGRAHV